MSEIYYSPGPLGMETIGEIQWGEASYDFDLTAVWRRPDDGAFFWAEDSGCSCPSPFESTSLDDLTPLTSLSDFAAHLATRDPYGSQAVDIAELLERLHKAGAR